MKIALTFVAAGMVYGDLLVSRGLGKHHESLKTPLKAPLIDNPLEPKLKSKGHITAKSGPNGKAAVFAMEGDLAWANHKEIPNGKTLNHQVKDDKKTVVGGWPRAGGQITTESVARRVKVKMAPGDGVGFIDRKRGDGTWHRETFEGLGQSTRWYKNEDDSQVTVKSRLIGGRHGGKLASTGKEYDQPDKIREWS